MRVERIEVRRILAFAGVAIGLTASALWINGRPPKIDPFSSPSPAFLDDQHMLALTQMKMVHADAVGEPFDIGLFGNSRSIELDTFSLKLPNCRFFNFSIPGQSLRSSVLFLEELVKRGLAPRLAVVSVDNFALQYYPNPSGFSASTRWLQGASDLAQASKSGPEDFARMTWRHLLNEGEMFRHAFDLQLLKHTYRNILGITPSSVIGKPGYREDGSRESPEESPGKKSIPVLTPGSPQIMGGILVYDLSRVAKIRDSGVDVLLYETPLHEASAVALALNPYDAAERDRAAFKKTCAKLGLNCRAMPDALPGNGGHWSDASHPPRERLGPWVAGLVRETGADCAK